MKVGEQMINKKVSKLMLKLPVIALTVMTQTVAMAQSSSSAAGTSTTTVEAAKPKVNKFGFTYANGTTNSFYNTKTDNNRKAHAVNAFSVSYKYSDDLKLALTMTNDYEVPEKGAKDEYAKYRDAGLSAATTYGSFLGTSKTPVKYKLFLPTTKASKEAKQAFMVAADITLSYDLTDKLSATAISTPYFAALNGSDKLRHSLETEIRYAYTPTLSNYIGLQHDIRALAGHSIEETQEAIALVGGVGYSPSKYIDLQLSVSRERILHESAAAKNETKEFSFLDEKEISYVAEAVVKF